MDTAGQNGADAVMTDSQKIHEPFTIQENIQQLNDIDKSIGKLMEHAATSLDALSADLPASQDASAEPPAFSVDKESKKESFRAATDAFLTTLQSIDVRMKRHIYALEEAGIVDLTTEAAPKRDGNVNAGLKAKPDPSLKPNGIGTVGNLDVGWLNSRSSKVERDMERELWETARKFLEAEGKNLKFG